MQAVTTIGLDIANLLRLRTWVLPLLEALTIYWPPRRLRIFFI
jgi:hypothetical protein